MKTTTIILLLLALIACCTLTGCQSGTDPSSGLMLMALHDEGMDSDKIDVHKLNAQIEFSKWDSDTRFIDETQPKEFEIEILGKKTSGVYHNSFFPYGSFVPCHVYRADDLSEFCIDSEGTLVRYYWEPFDMKNIDTTMPEEEMINLARDLFEQLTPFQSSDYSVSVSYYQTFEMTEILFQKDLNGIRTADRAQVYLFRDGRPFMFCSNALGTLPDTVDLSFNLNCVDQIVLDRCEELVEETGKIIDFDYVEYYNWSHMITVDEKGQYYVLVELSIRFMQVLQAPQNDVTCYVLSPSFIKAI